MPYKNDYVGCYWLILTTGHFYIGSSSHVYSRIQGHLMHLERGDHPNKQMQKLVNAGAGVKWSARSTSLGREAAYDLEQEGLDKNKRNPLLLNIARDARRSALGSTALTGRKYGARSAEVRLMKIQNGHGTHERTVAEKERLRTLRKGTKDSEEVRRKKIAILKQVAPNTGIPVSIDGVVYRSALAAAKELHIGVNKVRGRARNDKFPTWVFLEKPLLPKNTISRSERLKQKRLDSVLSELAKTST